MFNPASFHARSPIDRSRYKNKLRTWALKAQKCGARPPCSRCVFYGPATLCIKTAWKCFYSHYLFSRFGHRLLKMKFVVAMLLALGTSKVLCFADGQASSDGEPVHQ